MCCQVPNKDEQDKTKVLYDLEDLMKEEETNQIYEMENPSTSNTKVETLEESLNSDFFTKPESKEEKNKNGKKKGPNKIKIWWQKRSKKQKIAIITGLVIFVIALAIGIFFLVKSFKKEEVILPPVDVIVEEENYRYENGNLIFLNANKESIGSYTCKNQNEELCFVSYYSTEDNFDVEKKIYENGSPLKTRTSIIAGNYVFINDNPRKEDTIITLYDIKAQETKDVYQLVKKIGKNENSVILKNTDSKYGILNFTETESAIKLEFNYDYLGFIDNDKNLYVSTENGRTMLLDETGKTISKAINGSIKNANSNYIKVMQDTGVYEVYNYNAQNIFGETFEYVELMDDYAVLVKDSKMYLKFYDKNKLNEEGIPLYNKEYVKTNIYDEDNKLKETKVSFEIEETNNTITLTIFNENDSTNQTINKAEGTLSKTLKNINYLDGKLYIYKDRDKTELLGSYTCANKNKISGDTTTLSNCKLASDTIFEDNDYEIPGTPGVIPVFNERFIFISDNPDLVNDTSKTIVLYDLKKASNLGKYASVNTYSYTGTEEITFTSTNNLQVVAKNQSGKFGVIKIGVSEIAGHIGFNFSEMELLRDYYVAKDANGYLLLNKTNGSSVTSAIPYKIRNYNEKYVKVINNGKYYIYAYNGGQLTNKDFKYIELYDKFYAGVDSNNQLGLYEYSKDNNPKSFLKTENGTIPLTLNKYYGNGTLAFKINVTGNNYEVLVGNENGMYESKATGVLEMKEGN